MKRDDENYIAYKEQLHKFEHFTFLTDEEMDSYYKMSLPPKAFSLTKARAHPYLWAYHVVGVKPYDYQWKLLNEMTTKGKVAAVTSRQIGKSTMVGLFAFWAAYTNAYPAGIQKKTNVIIVSHTEDAAKKLLKDISDFVMMANQRVSMYTKDRPDHSTEYFTDKMVEKPTQYKLQWSGGTIQVLPPTDKVRGNSASVLIIDEADFLRSEDPDYFYSSVAVPTTTATKGKIFLLSTPRGTPSYYKNIIRPEKTEPLEGWTRVWYPWTIAEGIEHIMDNVWQKKQEYESKGDAIDFKIEYEASFLSGKHTFFNAEIIDKAVKDYLQEEYDWHREVTIGLDFGDTHSRTVLTVFDYDDQRNEIKLLWYKEFPAGYNNGELPNYIDGLRKRYFIKQIVVDDCVGGKTAIELLRQRGYNLQLFNFRKDKYEFYEYLKVAFANERIKMYRAYDVIAQLKSIESSETSLGSPQIRKPAGGRDDICDAFMMGCSPFIKPQRRGKRWVL